MVFEGALLAESLVVFSTGCTRVHGIWSVETAFARPVC